MTQQGIRTRFVLPRWICIHTLHAGASRTPLERERRPEALRYVPEQVGGGEATPPFGWFS